MNARSILHLERRQEVDRWLVVAERGQHARHHDLRRAFRSSSAFGPLLDMPNASLWIADDDARVRAAFLRPNERVHGRRIGGQPRTPWAVEEIARPCRWFPERVRSNGFTA